MLNVSNIGLMLYQTMQVATLDSITQIDFFLQTRCHHLMFTRSITSQCLSVVLLHAVLMSTHKEKVQCVLCSYSPCEILIVF